MGPLDGSTFRSYRLVTQPSFSDAAAHPPFLMEPDNPDEWPDDFEAVLGHSFGGHVALEYVLRYPERVSRLVLLDTAGDARWSQENAAEVLAGRQGTQPKDGGCGSPFLQGPDRSQGLRPRLHAARARLRPPVQPPAACSRDDRGRVADEDADPRHSPSAGR